MNSSSAHYRYLYQGRGGSGGGSDAVMSSTGKTEGQQLSFPGMPQQQQQ